MRYYRIRDSQGSTHLLAEKEPGKLVSLTSINDEVAGFEDLLRASHISGSGVDDIARHVLSTADGTTFDLDALVTWSRTNTGDARLIRPLDPDEMWAGGPGNYVFPDDVLTSLPDMTRVAYDNERPPMMYKGSGTRLAGPFDKIGVRSDTERTVAEGELVLVLYKGELVAYSTGNEVAGGLMGDTLWWMVPSKVFTGCASLGPCVVTLESLPDPSNLNMELVITRDGQELSRISNTTDHRRAPDEIAKWVVDHDSPPDVVLIYTGGCVADGQNPLKPGDIVRISLEGVGYVENTVEEV
jgi:2-dehydro-3-deoxy-D-arabinonate dehydratase